MYQSVVVPLLTYNCIANLNLDRTQLGISCSLDMRVSLILGEPMTPIFNLIKKNAVLRVENCISVGVRSTIFKSLSTKCQLEAMEKYLKFRKSSVDSPALASSSWVQESSILYPGKFVHHLQMTSSNSENPLFKINDRFNMITTLSFLELGA